MMQFTLSLVMPYAARSKTWYAICVCIAFFCEGGHFTLVPAMYKKLFGDEGVRVFGVGFSFIGIASLFQIALFWTIGHSVSQAGILYIFGAMCLAALLLLLFVFKEERVVIASEKEDYEELK